MDIDADLAAKADRDILDVVRSGRPATQVFTYRQRHYEARLEPELDAEGRVVAVHSVTRDVTARVHAADLLRQERDFAEEVVNTVREPMLVLDSDRVIQSANRSFEQAFGASSRELKGVPLGEASTRQFGGDRLRTLLDRVLGPEQSSFEDFDLELDLPARGRRTLRLNARRIDHLQRILLAMEDVTRQVETIASLEDELRQRNAQLEARSDKLRETMVELSDTEDRERQRLAELLHDDLQQMLVGINLHLEIVSSYCGDHEQAAPLLDELKQLVRDAIEKTRNLSHELSPATFRSQGLAGGLNWLAEQMRRQHRLNVEVTVDGEVDDMADSVRILLFKAVREMLFNIVKHANVDRATVHIVREPDRIEVRVEDHGEGFDADAVLEARAGHGLGLFSLKERLALLSGRLDVESRRGEGSRFRLRVPLHPGELESLEESDGPGDGESRSGGSSAE